MGFGLQPAIHIQFHTPLPRVRTPSAKPPPPRRKGRQRRVDRLWKQAGRVGTLICGVLGASCAFSVSACCAPPLEKIALAAGASFLTAFGGGTQSEALRWVVGRALGSKAVAPPRFAWRTLDPHVWAISGFLLACSLECTGTLGALLDSAGWRALLCLTSGLFVASGVVHSGWWKNPSSSVAKAAHGGCPVMLQHGYWRWRLSWLGTFLYCCAGGIWRDVLLARPPVAFACSTLVPVTAGMVLCRGLRELGDANGGRGAMLVLWAGTPLVACLFAAFA